MIYLKKTAYHGISVELLVRLFPHRVGIKGVAHGSLLTMRFSATAQTDNRRLPVPAVVMAPCSTFTITPR